MTTNTSSIRPGSIVMIQYGDHTIYVDVVAQNGDSFTGYPIRTVSQLSQQVHFTAAQIVRGGK